MSKKKLFSVVSTGILAFSTGAPSVLASTPFVLEILQESPSILETDRQLSDFLVMDNENSEESLTNLYITKDEEYNLILFGNSTNADLKVMLTEDYEVSIDKNEEFKLNIVDLSEEIPEEIRLEVTTQDNEVEVLRIDITSLLNSYTDKDEVEEIPSIVEKEDLTDNNPTEVGLEEELRDQILVEDVIDELGPDKIDDIDEIKEIEDSENFIETDNEQSDGITKNIEIEKNELSEAPGYERVSEVEELLHGKSEIIRSVRTLSRSVFSLQNDRTHENGVYTVKSGDTFNAIASSFNLSLRQLREWNGHVSNINEIVIGTKLAVNRRGVESMLSPTDKARLYMGGATPIFSTNQGFIDEIAPRAVTIANQEGEEGLWASLMIAQAAHESAYGRSSLSAPPYHNLSGLKGSHNGNSVLMWTWEVLGGERVDVLAGFRRFSSYDESLQSYANLLRRGNWDKNYYSGTWRSNTSSVWEVLDNGGLRGYATDPNYFAAIRRIITQYDLTQYDNIEHRVEVVENISNSKTVSYSGILLSGYSMDTHPWGVNGYQRVGMTRDYANQQITVVREAQNGAYLLVELNGELLGWVDHRAVNTSAKKVSNGINISYDIIIDKAGYSIDSLPWGTVGYKRIGNTSSIRGQQARVVQETKNGNYLLIEQDGKLIGWVDYRSVKRAIEVKNVAHSYPVDYTATITRGGYSLDSLPWGTEGYQRIDNTINFIGKKVQVTHEAGAYALVTINGTPLGWVDKSVLDGVPVRQNYSVAKSVNYLAKLRSGYTIDTLPWGVNGHKRISRTNYYSGETVRVVSQTGSYALIEIRGRRLGWVDRRSLQ